MTLRGMYSKRPLDVLFVSHTSHLPFEGQTPEELVDLEVARFSSLSGLAALTESDNFAFGDGSFEAHAFDYPSAGLRIRLGSGGYCDVGGVFLTLLVTHWQEENVCIYFSINSDTFFLNVY